MDDNRELVEEVWFELIKIYQQTNGQKALDDGIAYLFAYGEARYKAGVEAMRNAAFEPFSSYEYVGRMTLWHHLQDAARLLEAK